MIWRTSVVCICQPSNPGSSSTKDTSFVQCIDGWYPEIHEVWCLGLDGIICEVHPTAHVEVPVITDEEFVTNYLHENGRRIHIIRQLSINDSVNFLVFPAQA